MNVDCSAVALRSVGSTTATQPSTLKSGPLSQDKTWRWCFVDEVVV
jgi:hypothetical protein